MKTALFIVMLGAFFTVANAGSPKPPPIDGNESMSGQGASAGAVRSDVKHTFLDTLNYGKEVTLNASQLPKIEIAPTAPTQTPAVATTPQTQTQAQTQRNTAAPTVAASASSAQFRIQIMSLSSADAARSEKTKAENATNLPVIISAEQSLYKLYVGEFATRAQAEAALTEVRGKGYQDAWIVTVGH